MRKLECIVSATYFMLRVALWSYFHFQSGPGHQHWTIPSNLPQTPPTAMNKTCIIFQGVTSPESNISTPDAGISKSLSNGDSGMVLTFNDSHNPIVTTNPGNRYFHFARLRPLLPSSLFYCFLLTLALLRWWLLLLAPFPNDTYSNSNTGFGTVLESTSKEINRILARIEQDNKVLAELDRPRSALGWSFLFLLLLLPSFNLTYLRVVRVIPPHVIV